MKHIQLFENFLNEEAQFPAQFGIDEPVSFKTSEEDSERWGTVVKVSFTKAKVFYDILDDYTATIAEEIDSAFVKTLVEPLPKSTNEAKESEYPQEVQDILKNLVDNLPFKKYQLGAFNNYGVWFIELPMTSIHMGNLKKIEKFLPDFSVGINQGYSGLSIRTNISI